MRTGILWRGGEITMHVNIEQTVMVFLNGRANSRLTPNTGPAKIMYFDQENNRWSPLKPDEGQIELICFSADQWYKKRHKELTPVNVPVTV